MEEELRLRGIVLCDYQLIAFHEFIEQIKPIYDIFNIIEEIDYFLDISKPKYNIIKNIKPTKHIVSKKPKFICCRSNC